MKIIRKQYRKKWNFHKKLKKMHNHRYRSKTPNHREREREKDGEREGGKGLVRHRSQY